MNYQGFNVISFDIASLYFASISMSLRHPLTLCGLCQRPDPVTSSRDVVTRRAVSYVTHNGSRGHCLHTGAVSGNLRSNYRGSHLMSRG